VYCGFSKEVEEEIIDLIRGQGCMQKVIDEAIDKAEQRWECEEDKEACQRCVGLRRVGGERDEAAEADNERVEFKQ
jgi:hypothetical protein